MYPPRTYCEVLEEMRNILKHQGIFTYKKNTGILRFLIEELQVYGNRMESGLTYSRDLERLHKKRKELDSEVKKLKEKAKEMGFEEEEKKGTRFFNEDEDWT